MSPACEYSLSKESYITFLKISIQERKLENWPSLLHIFVDEACYRNITIQTRNRNFQTNFIKFYFYYLKGSWERKYYNIVIIVLNIRFDKDSDPHSMLSSLDNFGPPQPNVSYAVVGKINWKVENLRQCLMLQKKSRL